MTILLTGGTGYIGSHTAVTLLEAGQQVVLLDNLCNSRRDVVERIARIAGKSPAFVEGDVRDTALVRKTIEDQGCDSVIHFAGLKAVGESVTTPIGYYASNVQGTVNWRQSMSLERISRRQMAFGTISMSSTGKPSAATASATWVESAPWCGRTSAKSGSSSGVLNRCHAPESRNP